MHNNISCCGIGAYRIDIDKKRDIDFELSRFEFFWSMRLRDSRPDSITLICFGSDLASIVAKIESVIHDYAYISRITTLDDVVEFYHCKSCHE